MDNERFRQDTMNFQSALKEMAHVHMEAGEDAAAGLLLVLERRVYTSMLHYELQVPADGGADVPGDRIPRKRRSRKSEPEAAQADIPET